MNMNTPEANAIRCRTHVGGQIQTLRADGGKKKRCIPLYQSASLFHLYLRISIKVRPFLKIGPNHLKVGSQISRKQRMQFFIVHVKA